MSYVYEISLLGVASLLIIYLLATKDDVYVRTRDQPQPDKSKRNVINYYGWRGGMFIEDFSNFTTDNPYQEVVPVSRVDNSKSQIMMYDTDNPEKAMCHSQAIEKCNVPTLTAEMDWYNEHWNTPYMMRGPSDKSTLCRSPDWSVGDPGNFKQATNNNLDAPNNLKCQARSVNKDYCAPRDKVSPHCYVKELNKCMNEVK